MMRSMIFALLTTLCVTGCASTQTGEPLFNGRDLDGWVEIGSTGAWAVNDGVLSCNGQKEGYAWLGTERMYSDFVLTLEWKVGKEGNTGVFCRVPDRECRASMAGFEIQIVDDEALNVGDEICGSIFARKNAEAKAANPVGEWNQYVIRVEGGNVEVQLNGHLVNEIDFSEFENMKDVGPSGYIGLQNHGTPVWFRNVRIREIQALVNDDD